MSPVGKDNGVGKDSLVRHWRHLLRLYYAARLYTPKLYFERFVGCWLTMTVSVGLIRVEWFVSVVPIVVVWSTASSEDDAILGVVH